MPSTPFVRNIGAWILVCCRLGSRLQARVGGGRYSSSLEEHPAPGMSCPELNLVDITVSFPAHHDRPGHALDALGYGVVCVLR